jgi:hypothetical protein
VADNDNDKLALHPVCRSCGCQATGPSASFLNPRTGRTIYIYNGGAVDWCGMEMNKAASVGGLFQFTNVSCWQCDAQRRVVERCGAPRRAALPTVLPTVMSISPTRLID